MDLIITILYSVPDDRKLEAISDPSITFAKLSFPVVLKSVSPKLVHDYNKANIAQIEKSLDVFQLEIETSFSERMIETKWNIMKDKFNDLVLKFIPACIFQTDD